MVTAHRSARVSSRCIDIAAVDRSFGELLAVLGDLVVARSRGEPGASRRPAELVEALLREPLSAEPLLADLQRDAAAPPADRSA